jgi:hypothetical protein
VSVGTHFMAVVLRGAYPAPFQIWRASFPFAPWFSSGELSRIYVGILGVVGGWQKPCRFLASIST